MEESRQPLHDQQNRHRQGSESSKDEEEAQASTQAPDAEANVDHHGPEHLRELCRRQGRRGFTSVSGGVVPIHLKQKLKSSKLPLQRGGKQEGQQLL